MHAHTYTHTQKKNHCMIMNMRKRYSVSIAQYNAQTMLSSKPSKISHRKLRLSFSLATAMNTVPLLR